MKRDVIDSQFGEAERGRRFALVDCNNFYASCERVFRPDLRGEPVVVLSNNDGCVIARSEEAKELGVPMAVPKFQVEDLLEEHDIRVFSSNYPLYGDMSRRVVSVLEGFAPRIEEYSIDEVFLDLTPMDPRDWIEHGNAIVEAVRRRTGIPVSVGIAPSRSLAKVANERAKKTGRSVVRLSPGERLDGILNDLPPEAIWGIGDNRGDTLREAGYETALDLREAPASWLRSNLSIEGLRIAYELHGVSCVEVRSIAEPRDNIMSSRSFGRRITDRGELEEAVSRYVSRAAEKAREQGSAAGVLAVSLRTGRFGSGPTYQNSTVLELSRPTAATAPLVRRARRGLRTIFRPGYRYKKAGVMLGDLVPRQDVQRNLLEDSERVKHEGVMEVMDEINDTHGSGTVRLASSGLDPEWTMKSDHRSPHYTTRWSDLPVVKAG